MTPDLTDDSTDESDDDEVALDVAPISSLSKEPTRAPRAYLPCASTPILQLLGVPLI